MFGFTRDEIAFLAVIVSLLVLGVNVATTLVINSRSLRTARKLVEERANFEVDKVLEERIHTRESPRDDAKVEIEADLRELQRHSAENWFVLMTMLKRIKRPHGTPFVQHYAKLTYPADLKSFQPQSEHMFDSPMLYHVQKIRLMIRNSNIEIAEAVDLARTRDADEIEKATRDLLTKAGVMYTLWTAGMPNLHTATDWEHHGAIESARYDEIKNTASAEVIATLKKTSEPWKDKPLTMYNQFKPE